MADAANHQRTYRLGRGPQPVLAHDTAAEGGGAPARILVVDDDDAVGAELADILGTYGMRAQHVMDWTAALNVVRTTRLDLIILDQWLGNVDALTLLPELRALTPAYIVMLTGNKAEADRIVGLEVGADDFLQKPISGREIVARVRAHLRRAAPAPAPAPTAPAAADHAQGRGAWRVSTALRRVFGPDGEPIPLTSTEYELLVLLMATPGIPVDRETLSRNVLQRGYRSEDRALDNLVHNIRVKLGGADGGDSVIATVRNKGYAFTGFPEETQAPDPKSPP